MKLSPALTQTKSRALSPAKLRVEHDVQPFLLVFLIAIKKYLASY